MPIVGHLLDTYLFLTTNWIHAHLSRMRRWQPVAVARGSANREQFPLARVHTLAELPLVQRVWNKAARRVLGYYPFQFGGLREAQLLHAHFGDEGWRVLPLKRSLTLPLITTFYGYDVSQLGATPLWRARFQELFAEGDLFLVEGDHMRETLLALGCPPEKARVQHLGVDLAALPRRTTSRPLNQYIEVLTAATFREKKGIPDALAAFAAARRQEPRLRWTLIGDANPKRSDEVAIKAQLLAAIADEGLGDDVRLLGYQPLAVFRQELARTHVFLHPSVTARNGDSEGGAPVAIIEAQALGVPVISTHHADIPEVVVEGKGGFLVDEHDVRGLAERLLALAGAPEQWAAMAAAGRAHVEANYDLACQVARLEMIYDEVTKQHNVPGILVP